MDLRLLGPVEVLIEGGRRPLGGPRQRAVLADLALNAGHPISTTQLADDLWGESAPASATHTLQAYVSELRRALTVPGEPGRLVTAGAGYLLDVDPARVDALLFGQLTAQGRTALEHDDTAGAETLLDSALTLWRGPALVDVGAAVFAAAAAHRLAGDRLAALETLVDVRLRLGRHLDLVSDLEQLTTEHPFRERFHAQLMTALYRSGRQADALAAYQRARRLLVTRHGLEPGPELRALERAILTQAPTIGPATGPATGARPSAVPGPSPAPMRELSHRGPSSSRLRQSLCLLSARDLPAGNPATGDLPTGDAAGGDRAAGGSGRWSSPRCSSSPPSRSPASSPLPRRTRR